MRDVIDSPETSRFSDRLQIGLSTRLLFLTILFVLVAEILIFMPSIANFRNNWLGDRVAQARAAALLLNASADDMPSQTLVDELLSNMQSSMIVLKLGQSRRLLALADSPPPIDLTIDLRDAQPFGSIASSFDTLIFGGTRTLRVVGPAPMGGDFVELVIRERPLRDAMIAFSKNIVMISLLISIITASLVYAALNALIVRPVKRLATAMVSFRQHPEDARSLLPLSPRRDEIGLLDRELLQMQGAIQQQLRQREHLANLGLAVAKINHDLRNMLASALLMADRIGTLPDPNVQRFVPKLVSALERAIDFCQSTLAYGKGQDRPAQIEPVQLEALLSDLADQCGLSQETCPRLVIDAPALPPVAADAEHLQRVLTNLIRNARFVLDQQMRAEPGRKGEIHLSARVENSQILIAIRDTGPGLSMRARQSLFQAFSGVSHPGGTGLGLAIAKDLMTGMGGSIALMTAGPAAGEDPTTFMLRLPLFKANGATSSPISTVHQKS